MDRKTRLVWGKIKKLEEKIKTFRTTDEFLDFVKAMSRFHKYSFHNQMLIMWQKPDATRVAGFRTWKKFGRYVRKGEKGIQILIPIIHKIETQDGDDDKALVGYKSGYVFDLAQTNGKPMPEISLNVTDNGDGFYNTCRSLASEHKIDVKVVAGLRPYGASNGGQILLREDENKTAMAATLVHEIAHELLHQKADKNKYDRETQELEAETVAYVVCSHFGIDIPSHKYLATWQNKREIMDSLKRVSECSGSIIGVVEHDIEMSLGSAAP